MLKVSCSGLAWKAEMPPAMNIAIAEPRNLPTALAQIQAAAMNCGGLLQYLRCFLTLNMHLCTTVGYGSPQMEHHMVKVSSRLAKQKCLLQ